MNDKNIETIPPPNQPTLQPQQNPIILFGQAITNLSQRVNKLEIETSKTNANYEVMSNRVDLLKSTIELLEKQVDFNEKIRE